MRKIAPGAVEFNGAKGLIAPNRLKYVDSCQTRLMIASVEGVTDERVLLEAAIAAVRQWKFNPTRLSGKPVRVIGRLRFKFN